MRRRWPPPAWTCRASRWCARREGAMRCGPPSRRCARAAAMRCSPGSLMRATRRCAASRSPPSRAPPGWPCSVPGKPRASLRRRSCAWRWSPGWCASSNPVAGRLGRFPSRCRDPFMLWAALHFPCLPPQTLQPIAAWACQFTPKVSLEPPQALLLEIAGSVRYFGGVHELLQRLEEGCAQLGFAVALGTARTPRAALWRARGGRRDLDALALQAIGFDRPLFASIGIRTLGELRRLPREGLAQRCGQALLDDLDRALGVLPEPRRFFTPPPCFSVRLELPAPVDHAEGLLFAARRLLVQLEGLLAARHEGVRSFLLRLDETEIHVGLASVTRDAGRL